MASLNLLFLPQGVPQLVIPAKSGIAGREPGTRENLIILRLHSIPASVRQRGPVRNDGFGELLLSLEGRGGLAEKFGGFDLWAESITTHVTVCVS